METFSALLAICGGNSPVTGEFPAQRPVTRIFDAFFDLCLNKRLKNNREAGDLRRYRAHYDVIVMRYPRLIEDQFDSGKFDKETSMIQENILISFAPLETSNEESSSLALNEGDPQISGALT